MQKSKPTVLFSENANWSNLLHGHPYLQQEVEIKVCHYAVILLKIGMNAQ